MSDIVERLRDAARFLDELEDFPELQIRAADEITRLREENARLRKALIDILASLVASVDLLERGGKKAAPSDKMFAQMLVDYKNSIERGRAVAAAIREGGRNE